jgi:hypothetical protein
LDGALSKAENLIGKENMLFEKYYLIGVSFQTKPFDFVTDFYSFCKFYEKV